MEVVQRVETLLTPPSLLGPTLLPVAPPRSNLPMGVTVAELLLVGMWPHWGHEPVLETVHLLNSTTVKLPGDSTGGQEPRSHCSESEGHELGMAFSQQYTLEALLKAYPSLQPADFTRST